MEWDLVWGGDREDRLLAVEKQTGKTPQTLLNKPRLYDWSVWKYEAFWLCHSSRPVYQGSVGHIPLSEVKAYLDLFAPHESIEFKQQFVKMMSALDSVYLRIVNAEIKRKVEQSNKDSENEGRRNVRNR